MYINPYKFDNGGKAANVLPPQTPRNPGEIKSDDASWYERNIVRPTVTWLNTRPGGPFITVLKTAASFIPGVGEALDIAEGSPGWAAVGALPVVGDAVQAARRIIKETAPVVKSAVNAISLTPKQKSFWSGATKGFLQYSGLSADSKAAKLVVNNTPGAYKTTEYIPDIEQIITSKNIRNDLRHSNHPYRYQREGNTWYVYMQEGHRADPIYAGARMSAESALAALTKSLDANSVYIPRELLTLFSPDQQQSAFKAMANLMALKSVSGVDSAFDAITNAEIYKLAREGWNRGIWNSRNGEWNFDDFWNKNKYAITQLFKRVPGKTL